MKLLLIYPDFAGGPTDADSEEWGFYSEGLASISSVLKTHGHEVSLYHMKSRVTKDEFLAEVKKHNPDLIGFSVRTNNYNEVIQYIPFIKKHFKTPVICGSYHATLFPEEVLRVDGVDMVCIGEGEYPLFEILDAMQKGESWDNVRSVWVKKKDGEIVKNSIRPMIEDLNALPIPDFDLFDYRNLTSSKIYTAGVMLSRGCIFNCTYCCNRTIRNLYPNKNKYHRVRSPQNSIKYLKKLLRDHKYIKYISFWDNNLSLPREWCAEFLQIYKKEINLPFACNLHASTVDEEVIKWLKKAGCYRVHFGVEAGNEKFRAKMLKRGMKNEKIKEAFDLCRKYGISTLAYNMINCPMETPNITLDTIKLNAVIRPTRALAPVFYPFPGTEAYEISKERKLFIPTKNYSEDILLRNKEYPEAQVEFFSLHFRQLTKLYGLLYKFPSAPRKVFERCFDKIFTSRILPFQLLNSLNRQNRKFVNTLKTKLKNKMPKLYVGMRNLALGKKK